MIHQIRSEANEYDENTQPNGVTKSELFWLNVYNGNSIMLFVKRTCLANKT